MQLLVSSISTRTPPGFVCLLCRFHRSASIVLGKISPPSHSYASQHVVRRRPASTVSATAIDAKREIPPSFQELHATVGALRDEASTYVHPGQLQLALRGLESENAVTRVAGRIAS